MAKKRTEREKRVPDLEWFRGRFKALQLTQKSASSLVEMHASAFSRALTGSAAFSIGDALALSRALRVPVTEIIKRLGYDVASAGGGVALRGRVLETGHVSPVSEHAGEQVPALGFGGEHDAYRIEAPNGPLAIYNGMTLIADAAGGRGIEPPHIGRLCIVDDARQHMPLLGTVGQGNKSGNVVHVLGTTGDVTGARIVRTRLVRAIVL